MSAQRLSVGAVVSEGKASSSRAEPIVEEETASEDAFESIDVKALDAEETCKPAVAETVGASIVLVRNAK